MVTNIAPASDFHLQLTLKDESGIELVTNDVMMDKAGYLETGSIVYLNEITYDKDTNRLEFKDQTNAMAFFDDSMFATTLAGKIPLGNENT